MIGICKKIDNEQQDVDVACRPLEMWKTEVNSDLDVVLEDMLDAQGHWDQFEENEKRFGVKTSFMDDLCQYTTPLHVAEIPTGLREEAERIADEIENERKINKRFDADGCSCMAAVDAQGDEEVLFSAVPREPMQMQ